MTYVRSDYMFLNVYALQGIQIIAKKRIPENMRNDVASYVACISGAITLEEYQSLLKDAGLPSNQFSFQFHAKC